MLIRLFNRLMTLLDNLGAALAIGTLLLFRPLLQRWYNRHGAADAEINMTLPGDDRISQPQQSYTRAITIHAPSHVVWQWLVQIGQGRGGLYSYELLENLIGCQMHNAEQLHAEYQTLQPGDPVRLGPEGYPLYRVVDLQPDHYLLCMGADPKSKVIGEPQGDVYTAETWVIVLRPVDAATTRLLLRGRMDYQPRNFTNRLIWKYITEPIGFIMMRKMMIGIKNRAERDVRNQKSPSSRSFTPQTR